MSLKIYVHPNEWNRDKANNTYGYMNWFLNTDHKLEAKAPVTAFIHIGNGTNIIYVDPEHDLVAVVRWIENYIFPGFFPCVFQVF